MDILQRILTTKQYLEFLGDINETNWNPTFSKLLDGESNYLLAMALLNPSGHGVQTTARRSKSFRLTPDDGQSCLAAKVWGYECPSRQRLNADHDFPYSRGGPTIPSNGQWLCGMHNELKGFDMHFFDWEPSRNSWLSGELIEIAERRGIGRRKDLRHQLPSAWTLP